MSQPVRPPLSTTGRVFAVAAFVEAFTWAGLLVGMFFKYVTETTDQLVSIFGALHGGMFMIYVVVAIVAGIILRWRWWELVLALLASIPPLTTIPLEIWLRRRGSLAAPADRSATAGAGAGAEGAGPAGAAGAGPAGAAGANGPAGDEFEQASAAPS